MRDPILFNADCLDAMWFIEDGAVDSAARSVHTPPCEADDTVQAMREAGWSDDTLREMGLL